jgi:hypothetical protein
VRGLRGAMQDGIKAMLLKQREDAVAIADIEVAMFEAGGCRFQTREIPGGISRGPEENAPHIIVNADHSMAMPVEMLDSF